MVTRQIADLAASEVVPEEGAARHVDAIVEIWLQLVVVNNLLRLVRITFMGPLSWAF
jgi:hypothetical protein